jgi:hypothetical protein
MEEKFFEILNGEGEVSVGDKGVSKVSYTLKVKQGALTTESEKSEGVEEGHNFFSGNIIVLDGEGFLFNMGRLTLHIEDGHRVDFFVKKGEPMIGRYEIQPHGNFYLA